MDVQNVKQEQAVDVSKQDESGTKESTQRGLVKLRVCCTHYVQGIFACIRDKNGVPQTRHVKIGIRR